MSDIPFTLINPQYPTPTAAEREVGRRMNIDPNRLAKARVEGEPQRRANDAARLAEFERLTTVYNPALREQGAPAAPDARRVAGFERRTGSDPRPVDVDARRAGDFQKLTTSGNEQLARQAAEHSLGTARPTQDEREVARRMGVDPGKLAQAREERQGKERDEILTRWDGYINPGGPADRAYELTDLDREACGKLGVDPQAFLAWKRDPISAARPRGLPIDPYDGLRRA